MQPDDRSIHKLFVNRIFRHTNMFSIKMTIFYIIRTSHNLNNNMHIYNSRFIHCEAYPFFQYYEAYPLFVVMRLTLFSLLWGLHSLRYYDAYPLFVIMRLTLSSIIMKLTISSLLWGLFSLPLLWGLPSLRYFEAYPLFIIMRLILSSITMFMLYALQFKLYNLLFANYAFFKQ